MADVRRFAREQSLSLFFLALFLLALAGQAYAGWRDFNDDALSHGEATISLWNYVTSSDFGAAVMENWQSEYLQFTLFILLTVWLLQRGSPESKPPGEEGAESDQKQRVGKHADQSSPLWARVGGARTWVYSNSLGLLMAALWIGSWAAQSLTGVNEFNAEQRDHGEPAVSWLAYLGSARFWETTLQNWQSEFLAVGSMAVFAIYLRQRGSPESKPVGAPSRAATGQGG
jgi:hypothetical protein